MRPFSIPIKGLQIKSKLAHVLRRKSPSLEFKGNKTLKVPLVEQQIKIGVLAATWTRIFSPTMQKVSHSYLHFPVRIRPRCP